MPKKKIVWKQNLIKVPSSVLTKFERAVDHEWVVGTVKKIPAADIDFGMYEHLDIRFRDGVLDFPGRVLPNPAVGRWSKTNVDGKEIVRKDLPMYPKTFAFEAPNWGDFSSGTHTVYNERMVYPRDLIPPKYLDIVIDLIDEQQTSSGTAYAFRFSVDEVLHRFSNTFHDDLLYNLNILQENTGRSDIFASSATIEEYRSTVMINWEILPVGKRDENLHRILKGVRSESVARVAIERYDILERLRPTHIIKGTSGFSRYFGAKFADNLVVFENLNTGNALYVMYEDWEELSKKSRTELLKGDRDGFERVVHTKGWKTTLENLIELHRDLLNF
ncbi:MAG: hypothetical protein WD075_04655 [Rhodospirillales bacterium]